jgi:isopentenyl-diphosphate delta-isomerase
MPTPAPFEEVILVNSANRAVGRAEKIAAHRAGLRHRAFSIFIVDAAGRVLLQRRHQKKYHSGGLWANACCGHPRPGETTLGAARRRLREELGVAVKLTCGFRTQYAAEMSGGLEENEIVYVYFGAAAGRLRPNAREISATQWVTLAELKRACRSRPAVFAFWLKHYLKRHYAEVARAVAAAQPLTPKSIMGCGAGGR